MSGLISAARQYEDFHRALDARVKLLDEKLVGRWNCEASLINSYVEFGILSPLQLVSCVLKMSKKNNLVPIYARYLCML